MSRRSLWLGVLSIAVVAVMAVTAISYFAAQALTRHRSVRPSVTPSDSGLIYQTVPLVARDGTKLEGWWIIPRDGVRRPDLATVVLAHAADGERPGSLSGKAGMLGQAAWLSRAGFIVLAFDFRSYGGSEGRETTGGEKEQQDMEAALRLVRERAIGAPIAILGQGMGASVGLVTQAQDPGTRALVADSPERDRINTLRAAAEPWTRTGILARQFMSPVPEPRAFERLLGLAGAHPLMLIVGKKDQAWSADDRRTATKQLGPANSSWAWQPDSRRLSADVLDRDEYVSRVLEFFEHAFDSVARDSSI